MNRTFRRAIVVGKFLPPHRGHHHLIDTAGRAADHVDVMVCDLPGQIPTAAQRARWLAEIHADVTAHVVPDICGWHSPDPCPASCSRAWADHLCALGLGPWDVVVSSESYGPLFAQALGAAHIADDPDRTAVPISGTAVRADLGSEWRWLHPVVRAGLTRKVVVVGAESTGTTTLALDLAAELQAPSVAEYGRAHSGLLAQRFGSIHDVEWTPADFTIIADGQVAAEEDSLLAWASDEAATPGDLGPWLVCDTDLLATAIWHERYLDQPVPELVERALSERRPDLYVLTSHRGVDFHQDGLRDGEHLRAWMTGRFREVLAGSGVAWVEVEGGRRQRVDTALDRMRASGVALS